MNFSTAAVDWTNPIEACREYRRLDQRFGTDALSPLHHDNRCTLLHGTVPLMALASGTVAVVG